MRLLTLAVFLLLFIFFLSNDVYANTADNLSLKEQTLNIQIATPSSIQKPDYQLPYPGILPDNPLYVAKVVRDWLIGYLIIDPYKKAEFNLLQADKRFNAGLYLMKKNKYYLGISMLSKSENYFETALSRTREAKNQGINMAVFVEKLTASSKKHEELLVSLDKQIPKDLKGDWLLLKTRIMALEKQVISLRTR